MVIEWLRIRLLPETRQEYIELDAEIWTAFLNNYPGFLGKEVWLAPDVDNEVILVIRWQSREQWDGIPQEAIARTERRFNRAFGNRYHEIVESSEYQVRKFPFS